MSRVWPRGVFSALNRKLLRDLWRIKGQGFAIAMVISGGVAMYIMSLGVLDSLEVTQHAYYDRYRFADVFAHLKRAPNGILERIKDIPGVHDAESRIVVSTNLDIEGMLEPGRGRITSVPERGMPRLNNIVLRSGRWIRPGYPNEIIASEAFASAHGLKPGDTLKALINGRKKVLTIVGTGLSPEYIYSIEAGQLVPDDRLFGVLWMGRKGLAAAYNMEGAFNEVSLTLDRDVSEMDVIDRIDGILKRYGGVGAFDRNRQISHMFLASEMEQLKVMARILPPIFLGVAAFLLNIVVSRLIETERQKIGVLKAFGYTNLDVGWHYLKFVGVMTVVGVLIGFAIGDYLGRGMVSIYADYFRFPFLYFRTAPGVFVTGAFFSVAAATLGAITAVYRAVRLPAAEAMAPPTPTSYRRDFIKKLGLNRFFSAPNRMILRHITRWPFRTGMTVAGMSFAVGLVIGALFFIDAMNNMLDIYFNKAEREDISVSFFEPVEWAAIYELEQMPGVFLAEGVRVVPAKLVSRNRSRREAITGLKSGSELQRLLDKWEAPVALLDDGLVLSAKLAELLDATQGDEIEVHLLEGGRPIVRLPITNIVETFFGTSAYMNLSALNRLMNESSVITSANLMVDDRALPALYPQLKNLPSAQGVIVLSAAKRSFIDTVSRHINLSIFFNTGFGVLIAFGVVYNAARISLSERKRELASLRVLGYTRGEVAYILVGELFLLTFFSLPVGTLLGIGLATFMVHSFSSELYRIPLIVSDRTVMWANMTVLVSALVSALIIIRQINRLDLVTALKTRE